MHLQTYIAIVFFIICLFTNGYSQDSIRYITIDNAIRAAVSNHPKSHNAELSVKQAGYRKRGATNFNSTEIAYTNGQSHSKQNDQRLDIRQNFESPFTYIRKRRLIDKNVKQASIEQKLTLKEIIRDVKLSYFQCVYIKRKQIEIEKQNRKLQFIEEILRQMNEKGDSLLFELAVLETQYADFQNELFQVQQEQLIGLNQFQLAVYSNEIVEPIDSTLELYAITTRNNGLEKFSPTEHFEYYKNISNIRKEEVKIEKLSHLPNFYIGYFNQEINQQPNFQGFSIGVSLPISQLLVNQLNSKINVLIAENEVEYQKFSLSKQIDNLKIQLDQAFVTIGYFRENALRKADLIEKTADVHLSKKTITTGDYMEAIKAATDIRIDYLSKIRDYNFTAVNLEYLVN